MVGADGEGAGARGKRGALLGCIGRGEGYSPPSKVASLCPATVSLKASASFNGICNCQ